ncbi:hypothetical protein PIB30_084246 [Stylosanthes scabra]|uniref:Uncharacterized protein n=1 Tax=Stylosanthes scabra TaxID=79078 RepID=A0ABU6RST1_9FABA|nr:hypothetical protein [Stylosanthes scabra]
MGYAQNPTPAQSTRPIQHPHPTPENSKITSLSSSLLYGDRRCNQMPYVLTVSVAPAMIYYLILVAPSSLHCRGCTAVRRFCAVVDPPPPPHPAKIRGRASHKVLQAQNGGVPGFMADLRAVKDY